MKILLTLMYLILNINIINLIVIFGCKNTINNCNLLENINTYSDTIVVIDVPECVNCFNNLPKIINNIGKSNKHIYINSNHAQYNIINSMNDINPNILLNKWNAFYKFNKGGITFINSKNCTIISEYTRDQVYRGVYF